MNGPDSPASAVGELRLATIYAGESRYAEAGRLLHHALPIAESIWPEGYFAVADGLYQLAEVERLERQYANAELSYQKAIAVYEKCGPSGAAGLAAALRQYAMLLRTGRGDEVKALEKRAEDIRKSAHAFQ
jgi:tetratricopeptide (TPR) repeat protein